MKEIGILMKVAMGVSETLTDKLLDRTEPLSKNEDVIRLYGLDYVKREFSKGELIFGPYDEKDRIFAIKEGEVEIYQLSPEGRRIIIDILVPGDIFANSPLFTDSHLKANDFAMARSGVVLCILKKADFIDALESMPDLAIGLIGELSRRLNEAANRIRELAVSDATTRVISGLLRFGRRMGREVNGKVIIPMKLTHEELADMTGVTRETVTRALKELRRDGIIDLDGSRHFVIDKVRAQKICW